VARVLEPYAYPSTPGTWPAIVVLAASAGGLQAILTVFQGLPKDFPAPIVVVLHRPASRPSLLTSLLSRRSAIPVKDAIAGEHLESNTIYVASPDQHLSVTADGTFQYSDGRRIRFLLSSANPLFESSARAFGAKVIAVVLTGSGMDGTDGVQSVKAHGGIVIAQDRTTSASFGMPAAAIATRVVDQVLPLDAIGPALQALVRSREQFHATTEDAGNGKSL
jgi:two-component system chemotaxis response regulator CheB